MCRTNFEPFANDFTGDQTGARHTVSVVEQDRRQHIEPIDIANRRKLTRLVVPMEAPPLDLLARPASVPGVETLLRVGRLLPRESAAEQVLGEFPSRIDRAPRHSAATKLIHDAGMQTQQILKENVLWTHSPGESASHSLSPRMVPWRNVIPSQNTTYGTRGATGTARRARTSSYTGIPTPASIVTAMP